MDLERVFADVFEMLAKAAFVVVLYQFGKHAATIYPQRWRNYLTLLGAAVLLALAFAGSYGTHSEDTDPVRGGGRTVVDFVPTTQERAEQGLVALLVLVIPSFLGLAAGHERLPRQIPAPEVESRTTVAGGEQKLWYQHEQLVHPEGSVNKYRNPHDPEMSTSGR